MAMGAPSLTVGGSAWVWEPSAWRERGDQLLDRALRFGLSRLYVTIEIGGGVILHLPALHHFLATAEARHVAIEAVEGDPRMVAGRGLALATERATTLRAALLSVQDRRLAGVQYDVEPYTRRDWRGDAAAYARWGGAIARLAKALGEPVDLAVPFWLLEHPLGEAMLDQLRGVLRLVTVMAYRTAEAELFEIARLWTGWALKAGLPWQMAVEIGPGGSTTSFQGDLDRASAAMALARPSSPWPVRFAVHGLQL